MREKKLPIRIHELSSCPLPRTSDGKLAPLTIELQALGDFRVSNLTAEFLRLDEPAEIPGFPEHTEAIAARVTHAQGTWLGYGERRGDDGVSLLLWPAGRRCELGPAEGTPALYPGAGGGQALGYAANSGLVLAAGGDDPASNTAVVGALSFDGKTGEVVVIDSGAQHVLREPRAHATVTELGDRILVTGGENPLAPAEAREVRGTAEIYDPGERRFEPGAIGLLEARSRHAAVNLPNGDTLLIGGRNRSGEATTIIEAISAEARSSSIVGLPRLRIGRIDPRALLLGDGRVLIAGGYDAAGNPIASFEWLTPGASGSPETTIEDLVPSRFDRAFVAMPGGGLLAVGGCEDRAPMADEDCSACRSGCPPLAGYDAFWVSPDGEAHELELDVDAPRPVLLPGSDGRPWLFAGTSEDRVLYRFDPWRGVFERSPLELRLPAFPGGIGPDPITIGSDAFVWLEERDGRVVLAGARLGARSRYASDLALIIQPDQGTAHLAPDRPPGTAAVYDGALTLSDERVTVFVTDTDYGNFTLEIGVDGTPPPLVIVGDLTYGGSECPWPGELSAGAAPVLVRSGDGVELRRAGAIARCPGPSGRVTLGFRAGGEPVRISRIDVLRDL